MVAAYRDNEYTAKNCDLVELPKSATTGKRVSLYNGLGWAAAANGEHTEEAWQLIEYLGSEKHRRNRQTSVLQCLHTMAPLMHGLSQQILIFRLTST